MSLLGVVALRERRFALAYVANGHNGAKAAIEAGYAESDAKNQAHRMLKRKSVQDEVTKLSEAKWAAIGVTADRVMQYRAAGAFYDIRNLYRPDGSLKPVHELDEQTAIALQGLEVDEITAGTAVIGNIRKVKLVDRDKHLTAIEKTLGTYKQPDAEVPATLNIFINLE